jgi:hypothetical protein
MEVISHEIGIISHEIEIISCEIAAVFFKFGIDSSKKLSETLPFLGNISELSCVLKFFLLSRLPACA